MNKKTSIKKEEDTISLEEAFVKENLKIKSLGARKDSGYS
jgi:hypothetical protein